MLQGGSKFARQSSKDLFPNEFETKSQALRSVRRLAFVHSPVVKISREGHKDAPCSFENASGRGERLDG